MKKKARNRKTRKSLFWMLILVCLTASVFIPIFVRNANERQEPQNTLSEFYPEHPELSDCYNTSKMNFCIGDVAELKNDISLCYSINDPDIRNFCVARISFNKNLCQEIKDEGLKGACLESIELKLNWSKGL